MTYPLRIDLQIVARPAGLEPATPGLEGQPYEPDAVFFSVVCGFTHADSPRA